jgi:hypothetical protein
MKSSRRVSEGPHGQTLPQDAAAIQVPDQKKRDRQCGSSGEAVLAQRGESDVRHHLNAGVRLATDDGP